MTRSSASLPIVVPVDGPDQPSSANAGGRPVRLRRALIVDNGVLGMAIFLTAEVMMFGGLISSYLILRSASSAWPPVGQPRLPIEVTGFNTLILLCSAFTMHCATAASRVPDRRRVLCCLTATAGLGSMFLVVQGWEWVSLLDYGLSASSSIFGGLFYTLIGCHAVHVVVALFALFYVLLEVARDHSHRNRTSMLETFQLYWFFVVGIWPVLYYLVYLM